MNKQEWYDRIGENNAKRADKIVSTLVEFAKNHDFQELFSYCGLYAVGSSVRDDKETFHDIDIVLAGLPFKAIFYYTKIFLQDMPTLIENKILLTSEEMSKCLDGESSDGQKFEYNGKTYYYHPANSNHIGGYDSLLTYTFNDLCSSSLTKKIVNALSKKLGMEIDEPITGTYHFEWLQEMVLKIEIPKTDLTNPFELILHGENLVVPAWKKYQEQDNFPYLVLHEWENANINASNPKPKTKALDLAELWSENGKLTLSDSQTNSLPLPDFIDPERQKKSRDFYN